MYDLRISFVTYATATITGVTVSADKATVVNVQLGPDNLLPVVEIPWEEPLIDPGNVSDVFVLDAGEIDQAVSRDIKDLVAMAPGVYQQDEGGSLNVRGSRDNATQYIVDGVKMTGPFSLPKSAIAEITVITGGVPAQYGDATGGIIVITTKSYRNHKH
jgi:outer membrane receptor protein involved in Fe transport